MAARKASTTTRNPAAPKAAKVIPPAPTAGAPTDESAANADATANASTSEAARPHEDLGKTPGDTLNPSDPNAPNYRFAPTAEADALNSDQGIDHGTGVQPSVRGPDVGGGGAKADDNGLHWTVEDGPRGRVVTVTKGQLDGPTTTYEDVLPLGATEGQIAASKEKLHRRFLAA